MGRIVPLLFLMLSVSVSTAFAQTSCPAQFPYYPNLARMARVEGIVKVEFEIAKDGKVSKAVAKSGHPILQNGSVDVVKALQFQSSNRVRHETIEFRYHIRGKEGISRCAQLWINLPVIEVTQTPPELNVNVSY